MGRGMGGGVEGTGVGNSSDRNMVGLCFVFYKCKIYAV